MEIKFEIKPTAHESNCVACGRKIEKGEKVLKALQTMYPGTRVGRMCIDCLREGMEDEE
ncbi:hypothetical protein KAI04_04165 [Candidatus Pacearchaeota archaeon]|nr:hypothetical protein [Candidatus Pacearchaeota archaeon]